MNETLLLLIFNIAIMLPLYYASKEDMKYHRIDKKYVIIIFILVLVYTLLTREYVIERTFSLLITLGIFGGITFISKGGFGFGDTLILTALGWYIGSLIHLRYFFLILVFVMLVWGSYHILKYKTERKGKLKDYFKSSEMLPISKIKPGMILAKDYFMTGLTENDIEKMKKDGFITVNIKHAYPFIPVILITFLAYIIFSIYII